MENVILRAENIYKRFGALGVLKGVNVEVSKGDVVAVIGPSGSGKSTFLRCVNRLEKIEQGKITVDGEVMVDTKDGKAVYAPEKEVRRIRSHLGMVFQSFNLFRHMTALQNVMEAPVRVKKMPKADAKKRALELLEKVGLADQRNKKANQLSGGQKQRVAIARAMINEPSLILADEPTGALDSKTGAEIIELLGRQNASGTTVVIITHDRTVSESCGRVVRIADGVLE